MHISRSKAVVVDIILGVNDSVINILAPVGAFCICHKLQSIVKSKKKNEAIKMQQVPSEGKRYVVFSITSFTKSLNYGAIVDLQPQCLQFETRKLQVLI